MRLTPPDPNRLNPAIVSQSYHLLTHGLLADGGQCPHCGYVKPGPYRLTVEQEIRARALDAVARLDWYPDDPDATPADATLRLAARFAAWIDTGANPPDAEIVDEDDPLDLESGPDAACSCNPAADPDPTEHVHAAPWGCTVCPCRHYPDRSMPLSEALAAVQDAYREHETTVEAPDA